MSHRNRQVGQPEAQVATDPSSLEIFAFSGTCRVLLMHHFGMGYAKFADMRLGPLIVAFLLISLASNSGAIKVRRNFNISGRLNRVYRKMADTLKLRNLKSGKTPESGSVTPMTSESLGSMFDEIGVIAQRGSGAAGTTLRLEGLEEAQPEGFTDGTLAIVRKIPGKTKVKSSDAIISTSQNIESLKEYVDMTLRTGSEVTIIPTTRNGQNAYVIQTSAKNEGFKFYRKALETKLKGLPPTNEMKASDSALRVKGYSGRSMILELSKGGGISVKHEQPNAP